MNRMIRTALIAMTFVACLSPDRLKAETIVDFEELTDFDATLPEVFGVQFLGAGDVFNGYASGAPSGEFTSKGVSFETEVNGPGFSYSRYNNTSSVGFGNQFAAWPGAGSNGAGGVTPGSTYGMVYTRSATLLDGTPTIGAVLNFDQQAMLTSIDVANATYSVQYFLNGLDGFGDEPDAMDQFGDGDFFQVQITGFDGADGAGNETGFLSFDLADFEGPVFDENDYVDGWETLDLSGFGATRSLRFATTSSQISDFGNNRIFSDVPAYVAIDNLRFVTAVPEPGFALVGLLGGSVTMLRRGRRSVN